MCFKKGLGYFNLHRIFILKVEKDQYFEGYMRAFEDSVFVFYIEDTFITPWIYLLFEPQFLSFFFFDRFSKCILYVGERT